MPIVIEPYIPETITVHLGPPNSAAENVTVSFPDYVKNVASSEIYPTWEPAAIRANVLAIISFALNRVYTEFYPSRGYDFQITSSTAYDQKFIRGRNFFDSISVVVDEIFDDYLRRQGTLEPLAANVDSIMLLQKKNECDQLKSSNYIKYYKVKIHYMYEESGEAKSPQKSCEK